MINQDNERSTSNIFNLDKVRRQHEAAQGISRAAIIDSVPGFEGPSKVIDPSDVVAEINKQLAERDPSLPAPTVQAGDHGVKTQ